MLRHDPVVRRGAVFTLLATALSVYSFAGDGLETSSLPRVHSHGGGNSSTTVRRSLVRSSGECDIKGNINAGTGERIYHVPGQTYYAETVVNPLRGERWFCSEVEARAAG